MFKQFAFVFSTAANLLTQAQANEQFCESAINQIKASKAKSEAIAITLQHWDYLHSYRQERLSREVEARFPEDLPLTAIEIGQDPMSPANRFEFAANHVTEQEFADHIRRAIVAIEHGDENTLQILTNEFATFTAKMPRWIHYSAQELKQSIEFHDELMTDLNKALTRANSLELQTLVSQQQCYLVISQRKRYEYFYHRSFQYLRNPEDRMLVRGGILSTRSTELANSLGDAIERIDLQAAESEFLHLSAILSNLDVLNDAILRDHGEDFIELIDMWFDVYKTVALFDSTVIEAAQYTAAEDALEQIRILIENTKNNIGTIDNGQTLLTNLQLAQQKLTTEVAALQVEDLDHLWSKYGLQIIAAMFPNNSVYVTERLNLVAHDGEKFRAYQNAIVRWGMQRFPTLIKR